jgi:hypothetical protein
MFPEQLKKILNLIKKTHDRVVIFDGNNPDDSYVIMDLDNYLDAAVKADKLPAAAQPAASAQLAVSAQPVVPVRSVAASQVDKAESVVKPAPVENLTEEDLTDKINREISMWKNQENAQYLAEENKAKKAWQIPSVVKDKAQEVE